MIIHADDFGISASVNEAVCACFRQGLVNRTSILVNMPEAAHARELAEEFGFLGSVGLHINLTEGRALTKACRHSSLCDENGYFKGDFHVPIKARFFLPKKLKKILYDEIEAQIQAYLAMGFTLKHADSHNYVHTYLSVASEVNPLLKKYDFRSVRISRNIPPRSMSPAFSAYKALYNFRLRHLKTPSGRIKTTKYFGSVEDFEKLDQRAASYDDTELMTHPTYQDGVLYDATLPHPHPFLDHAWLEKNNAELENFSDPRIRLLVVFIQTHVGGAMTSLVNFLNALDCSKYNVDVLFYEDSGGRHGIKDGIHILRQAKEHRKYSLKNILGKTLFPPYILARLQEIYYKKFAHNRKKAIQIIAKQGCRYSRRLHQEYDIAVAYEINWCLHYTVNYVRARKKIIWHHLDFDGAGLDFRVDRRAFDTSDAMVFVSEDCLKEFTKRRPQYQDICCYLPNLLSSEYVRNRGAEEVTLPFPADENTLKMLTVARIDFTAKGLDRGVRIIEKLRDEGLAENLRWLIIGKGKHSGALCRMIEEKNLQKYIYWIGLKENPIPYMKLCDVLFLPSLYEGKPMVVTEAQIMGLVPLVSRYTSADEQIRHGIDGLICDNNEEALYAGVKEVVLHPEILDGIRRHIQAHDFGNDTEIKQFDKLVDKLMAQAE